jgi:sigma-B regulation protein RsbU (phosphoserine phosphatase)
MMLTDIQLTAGEVLQAYHRDEPLLFLASAFITVAIVAAALCVIRRRFDPLLVYLALFAYLYGQRLRLNSEILDLGSMHSGFFLRLRSAINYLVPMPAFGFFDAAGFLGRRGKTIATVASLAFFALVVGTFIVGPHRAFDDVNNVLVVLLICTVVVSSQLVRDHTRDFKILRAGVFCFVVPAVYDNIRDFWAPSKIEPYGFALLLASLGYVAAHRTLRRDVELSEMRNELELAQRIQLSILPAAFPESEHFQIAARYVPMTSVAGDFYDFLISDKTHAGLLIADVSGHGVPAALIASMVKMAATAQRNHAADPAKLLGGMNDALVGNTQGQFVTAAYVHLDAAAGEFRYAAAGHPPMILLRNGAIAEVIENGFLLAAVPGVAFSNATHALEAGDRLVLYTDGLTEARNSLNEMYGEEALQRIVRDTAILSAAEAADHILDAIQQWAKGQDDDLTLLICDYRREY